MLCLLYVDYTIYENRISLIRNISIFFFYGCWLISDGAECRWREGRVSTLRFSAVSLVCWIRISKSFDLIASASPLKEMFWPWQITIISSVISPMRSFCRSWSITKYWFIWGQWWCKPVVSHHVSVIIIASWCCPPSVDLMTCELSGERSWLKQ